MKEGWERTGGTTPLNLEQLNEIIHPAFTGKRIVAAERLGVGLSNSNYKIFLESKDNPYVLRIFNGSGDVLQKENAIAKWVHETVPVAEYIHMDTSCSILDKPWCVLEWKEGTLLRDVLKHGTTEDIAAAASSVGGVLAKIHKYKFSNAGFLDKDLCIHHPLPMSGEQFALIMEQILFQSPCCSWLGEELSRRLWSFCQANSLILSETRDKPVLVHSDFNGLNILMQQDRAGYSVSAVLDWEFAFSWRRHVDLANILRYEEDGSLFEKHFIRAYQEQGEELQENWKLISKLEDLVALCDMLSHCTESTPNRTRDLQQLIARTIQK
ncbi:phosphotransferase family protein [Paenibacillus sp. UNC451MF]|uniref:phosphotransferase family protein n=1 Tax=Paenibacillus sp. UNC451MF TaxID=1449063 RepID=UPI00048F8792|nr:aminoglycoside phosphotransferase family protein [Paenibacillus sp. UNC451MF]